MQPEHNMRLLIQLLLFVEVMTGRRPADRCREFLYTDPLPLPVEFHINGGREVFVTSVNTSDSYELYNVIEFRPVSPVAEARGYVSLCVGFVGSVSHSVSRGQDLAFARLSYRPELAAGVVNVSAACWRRTRQLVGCEPLFMAMPGVMDSPVFRYSPQRKAFWTRFRDDSFFQRHWVTRVAVRSYSRPCPSTWVAQLRLEGLKELDLRGNDWRRPRTLLGALPHLEVLILSENNIETLPGYTFQHLPALRKVMLGSNNITQFPHSVQHVAIIHLDNQRGKEKFKISKGDISGLSKVEELRLDNTRLHSNLVDRLITLPNIRNLYLSRCWMGEIRDNREPYSAVRSELIHLDLSYNNLTGLPRNIFSKLNMLNVLYLQHNVFESCPGSSLRSLRRLRKLDLSCNRMIHLAHDCFLDLHALKYLDLSRNGLRSLEALSFRDLESLETLDLSHNALVAVPAKAFLTLGRLRALNVSHNELTEAPALGQVAMRFVDLSHNRLTRVASLIAGVSHITFLDVSWNSISELKVKNISELDMSFNLLTYIPESMWKYLVKLKHLDLGGIEFDCCHKNVSLLQRRINSLRGILRNLNRQDPITCYVTNQEEKHLLSTFKYEESHCNIAVMGRLSLGSLAICVVVFIISNL